jgi:hypothetical protein
MPYPSSSYKGTPRSNNATTNDPGSNTINNFDSALEVVNVASVLTTPASSAKYPSDAPKGTVKLADSTNMIADLNAYLLKLNTILANISTEIGSASATQKSYIEYTQGNDLVELEAKIAKVNLEIKKLFETMNLASIQDKPGFVEFPNGGSRYPSGRNRY